LEALPVIARLTRTRLVAPLVVLAALGLGLVCLPGCETESYSEGMIYPVREDAIVDPQVKPTSEPVRFEPPGQWAYLDEDFEKKGGKLYEADKLTAQQREAFQKMLDEYFGTPANPIVKISDDLKKDLQLGDETLAEGSSLYRRHCLHCHGLTGDGHGPTAPWVNPHPRDYRPGKFKFTSTSGGNARKPTRADLIRTLKQGVEGTSMPSFGLLPDQDLNKLVSYVMHLSIRGQIEFDKMREIFASDPPTKDVAVVSEGIGGTDGAIADLAKSWQDAQTQLIKVEDYPYKPDELEASIIRGHKLFLGQGVGAASCISCHTDYGRQSTYKYDEWGTIVRPRDVTQAIYRGGRRPVDLYYRIYGGINGTPMPAFVTPGQKSDDEWARNGWDKVWDMVNFIQALPYPGMLPKEVRDQIYVSARSGELHASASGH
jgi:mono/diheme cytochrome c family protein